MSSLRVVLAFLLAAGCASGVDDGVVSPEPPELTSTAFTDGGDIPLTHTCDGDDLPLPLAWNGTHPGAVEVVLEVHDPDAPRGTFVHWLVAGLPPTGSIADGVLPEGAVEGVNGFGEVGYGGPCPPRGDAPHGYRIQVTGVSEATGLPAGFTAEDLDRATGRSRLSSATLTGRYGR